MSRTRLAAVAIALGTTLLHAQSSSENFQVTRPIHTEGPGHYRLAVDATLLARTSPFSIERRPSATGDATPTAEGGLADLRLFDAKNREVPYLLVRAPRADANWIAGIVRSIAPTKDTSGLEVDFGAPALIDRIALSGLRPPFLKRATVEGSGDRQHWITLAAEATLFDLPDERLRQIDVPFAADRFQYVRLTWDDRSSGRMAIPSSVLGRRVNQTSTAPPASASVTIETRPGNPGISHYRVRLPGPHLPIAAIVLAVGPGHVNRLATVSEPRLHGLTAEPIVLGESMLSRVMRNDVAADNLRIPIDPPREAELDLSIHDGDNPPLALTGVTVEFAELPWIYFESDGSPIVARYGHPGLTPPRYDLEAARASIRIEDTRLARWEAAVASVEPPGSAAPLPTTGATIDTSSFRYSRSLPSGDAGLVALALDADVLATSAEPARLLADVRIVDAASRQIPYLIERRPEYLELPLTLARTTSKAIERQRGDRASTSTSVYRVRLPNATLPPFQLVLSTDARVFDRPVVVGVERPPDQFHRDAWIDELRAAHWIHTDATRDTPALSMPIAFTRSSDLVVLVDEGDNAPLPLSRARLLLPAYRLRFYRPAGTALRLIYGNSGATAPRYDLQLLASQVLGVAATEIAASPAGSPSTDEHRGPNSPIVFWTVLVAAVIVLLVLIVRLLKPAQQT